MVILQLKVILFSLVNILLSRASMLLNCYIQYQLGRIELFHLVTTPKLSRNKKRWLVKIYLLM